jgi:hypothetical protein
MCNGVGGYGKFGPSKKTSVHYIGICPTCQGKGKTYL